MERNNDNNIIHMDLRRYYDLIRLAEIGQHEVGGQLDGIKKHVRRFNPFLQQAHVATVRAESSQYRKDKRRANIIAGGRSGHIVYIRETSIVLDPVAVVGIPLRDRTCIRVTDIGPNPNGCVNRVREVYIGNIVESLPEGYVFVEEGYYAGKYMLENR
jgi:hypothetical protein